MEKTARDIMTTKVITTTTSATILEVARLLTKNKISGMPVVSGDKVVGIISEADILTAAGETTVDWVMSRQVVSVGPETPLDEIAQTLRNKAIKRVVVVDPAGSLLGIVSRADIIAATAF